MKKQIIIMGGGFAGLRAYYHLIKEKKHLDITVIDKREKLLEKPALPEVAYTGKSVNHVLIDFEETITRKGGKFIQDEVIKINPKLNHIHLKKGDKLDYDYLIIATGAVKSFDAIEGFEEYGHSVCDDKHAVKLWVALKKFKGGNVVIGTAKSEFGHRVDAPNLIAPCEGPIGESMFMVDYDLREREIREESTIKVFTPGEIFFEDIGDHVRNTVGGYMQERDITLHNNKVVTKITQDKIYFEDQTSFDCDLAIIIPPYKALPMFKECGLGDDAGFIPTDKTMKHLDYDNIYAIGDINALAQPKLGHISVHQADIAASAILKEITGEGEIIKFEPRVFCIMNMGGSEASLIYSDVLYGGPNDLIFHSPLARIMKWSFDTYFYFTHGHMLPDFAEKGLEKILQMFKEDPDKNIPFE